MLFLLDTNAISDYMRGNANVASRLRAASARDVAIICPVVRGEISFGIGRLPPGRRRTDLEAALAVVLPNVPCLPLPESAGDHYAALKLTCHRIGVALGENDLWIAATTLALGATLVTRDQDFTRVPGLTIVDWSV